MASGNRIRLDPKKTNGKNWPGTRFVVYQFILSGVLLVLAAFVIHLLSKEAFSKYANCQYLVVDRLGMDPFFCDGYAVEFLGSTIFTLPGLKDAMDPSLERIRTAAAWGVILFFACFSLLLAIILNNLKTLARLIRFDGDEWKKAMAGVRIWLFLFLVFCSAFYVAGIK